MVFFLPLRALLLLFEAERFKGHSRAHHKWSPPVSVLPVDRMILGFANTHVFSGCQDSVVGPSLQSISYIVLPFFSELLHKVYRHRCFKATKALTDASLLRVDSVCTHLKLISAVSLRTVLWNNIEHYQSARIGCGSVILRKFLRRARGS